MTFLKNILHNYLYSFLEENTITVMCWDLETNGNISFYLELHSYPPIGSIINMDKYSKLFKIESLEIQNSRGAFCIAEGVFIDKINRYKE